MHLFKISFCLVALIVLLPADLLACSCIRLDEAEHLKNAAVVFEGSVSEIQEISSPLGFAKLKVSFSVEKIVKGDPAEALEVRTAKSSATCGYGFVIGKRYRVFADSRGDTLQTGMCSGNTLLK